MAYTREEFGIELKQRVANKQAIGLIGKRAYSLYMYHCLGIDDAFGDMLLKLNYMLLRPEFAFSYEKLNQIADDLIAGKEVKL